jgi:hypothetical protein
VALTAGSNVSVSGTYPNFTISSTDTNTTYSVGDGGLSEKNFTTALNTKLSGIATSANNYSLPTASSSTLGGIKIGSGLSIDGSGVVTASGGGGGSSLTVQDEGSSLSTAATTLNFAGNGVVASGTGATKTITVTDTNTTYSVGDGGLSEKNFTTALNTKLSGIEASATADQTASEIRTLVESASDSNVFTDADHSKLNAIAASATANPNALDNLSEDSSPQLGGNLDVNGNDIVSTSNGSIDLDPNGSGKVTFKGNSTRGAGQFVLNCENNSHGITIKGPPHSAGASYTLTLPDNDGSNGQSLITDGSGNTSWSTISGGSSYTLPIASYSTLGGIKVGSGLSVNSSTGLVNLNMPAATTSAIGGVLEDASGPIAIGNTGLMTINSNAINADQLNVSGNGSTSQYLRSDGDGTFTWATPTDTNTTYSVGDGGLTQNNFTDALKTKLDGISASANNYSLPTASGSTLGGIKIGSGLSIDGSGVVTASGGGGGGADLYAANESSPTAQPSATGTNAIAIGDSAVASGLRSTAIGKARATGTDTFAANISTNSNYGAQGTGSTAIGTNAHALGSQSISLGQGSYAGHTQATAIGAGTYATGISSLALAVNYNSSYGALATSAVAIGNKAKASATQSIAIGNDALSTTANLIALGGASDTVKISGAFTLPTSDGSANQVLTTNGSGVVTFADAGGGGGGGADLYAANESSPSAQPSATGTNAIAIGDSAIASGSQAVALSLSRASGSKSFAAGIGDNSTSYGASSNNTVAIGGEAKANSGYSTAIGYGSSATGGYSLAMAGGTASGGFSLAIGQQCTASAEKSIAIGWRMTSNIIGKFAVATNRFAGNGDNCSASYRLQAATTNATATVMTTNQSSASSNNQIVAASDTAISFLGTITAIQNGAQAYASWKIEGLLVNDGGTTTLANSAITVIQNASNWGMALSADNTNNALAVTCTGEASHNIRWMSNIQTSEVTYS